MGRYILALIIGFALGCIGARMLFVGSAWSLLPWSIAGLILGGLAASLRNSVGVGMVYGFCLAFFFMVAGYNGTEPIMMKALPFAIIGLVGAAYGAVVGIIGYSTRRLIYKLYCEQQHKGGRHVKR